ncbi:MULTISPECIES: DUF7563 family protein [Halorussus]|uniref:DUF7563 family protein n=1 Tax=Halorussus TaxID=1070314 RepID=UPI0020A01CCE|nr:hypothetical protein [Halorussus vallis]USZ78255.1 hypothetical protein NGM07_23250 [Halorussus vallis]
MSGTQNVWTPTETQKTTRRCTNCGEHVTRQFARVFGDNADTVKACPNCATYRELDSADHHTG